MLLCYEDFESDFVGGEEEFGDLTCTFGRGAIDGGKEKDGGSWGWEKVDTGGWRRHFFLNKKNSFYSFIYLSGIHR